MVGNRTAELREYQRAAALGLRNWDLFLNMGLAQLENGDLDAAMHNLGRAVLLGEDHPDHISISLSSMSGADCLRMPSARCWRHCG